MSSKRDEHWTKTKLDNNHFKYFKHYIIVIHWFGASEFRCFSGAYFMAGMGSQVAFAVLVF